MADYTPIPIVSPGVDVAVVRQRQGDWEFLILKRAGPPPYAGTWSLLSGSRENNESIAELVMREMAEEVQLQPTRLWSTEYLEEFYEPLSNRVFSLPVLVAIVDTEAEVTLDSENTDFRWVIGSEPEAFAIVTWRGLRATLGYLAEELQDYPHRSWLEIPLSES